MFTLDNSLHFIEVAEPDVAAVYRSTSRVTLAPAGLKPLTCEAFACVVTVDKPVRVYAALLLVNSRKALVYNPSKQPTDNGSCSETVREALDFLEAMGFKMESVNLNYSKALREVIVRDIPLFRPPGAAAAMKKTLKEKTAHSLIHPDDLAAVKPEIAPPPAIAPLTPSIDVTTEELAALKAEAKRLASEKTAAEKAAADEIAAIRAELESLSAEKRAAKDAEQERLKAEKEAAEALSALKAEADALAAEKTALEKAATEELAALKSEMERLHAEKTEAEKAGENRLAEEKSAAEQGTAAALSAIKAELKSVEEEKTAAKKAADEELATLRAELERLSAKKCADEKAEQELLAAEKAATETLAAIKAEAERLAAEKAEEEKAAAAALAALKAQAEQLAAEKTALEKTAAEELAAVKADLEKLTAEKKRIEEKGDAENGAAKTLAGLKAQAERLVAEKTEVEKAAAAELAALKAKMERMAAEKSADDRTSKDWLAQEPPPFGSSAANEDLFDPFYVAAHAMDSPQTFHQDNSLQFIEFAREEEVIKLYQSINTSTLNMAGHPPQSGSAYICVVNKDGAGRVYVALLLMTSKKALVYAPEKEMETSSSLEKTIQDAIYFAETVGFMMEPVELGEGERRSQLLGKIPVLRKAADEAAQVK